MNSKHGLFRLLVSLASVVAISTTALVLPVSADPPPPVGEYVPGEILVKFKPAVAALSAQSTLQAAGLQTLEIAPYSGVMRVRVTPGREAEVIAALAARQDIAYAEPNYILTAFGDPNDPGFSQQWALKNTGQSGGTPDADIDAPEAWDTFTGNGNAIVAIADTGVDLDHEDLQAKIWVNSDEVVNGVDDDANGFVDDVRGWDFCSSPYDSSSVRCQSPQDNQPDDEFGHGTHVAGIAAAQGNNGKGMAGVSWGATIMPVKVLDAWGKGTTSSIANGINYAVANGATVINMSLGAAGTSYPCTGFETIHSAMQNALSNGVLIVVAAGNENAAVSCPAAFDEAFAVGATNDLDTRWYWNSYQASNYGSRLDIAAPGEDIYSSINTGGYGYKTGTSMATPHVAGLAALIQSFSPGLTHTDIRNIIQSTADDLGAAGWDQYYGYGRINAWRVLTSLTSLETSPEQVVFLVDDASGPLPATYNIQLTTTSTDAITWTASISPGVGWLSIDPPPSGTVSAASADSLTLLAARPAAYGTYTTNLVVTATLPSGSVIGPAITEVRITYQPQLYQHLFPRIYKNYTP